MKKSAIILLAALLCSAVLTACEVSDPANSTNFVKGSGTQPAGNAVQTSGQQSDISIPDPTKLFQPGDYFQTEDFKITLKSADLDYQTTSDFQEPDEGYKYIFLKFEYENIGKDDSAMYSSSDFECYADNTKQESKMLIEDSVTYGFDVGSISIGRTAPVSVVFQVPKDAKEIELEYVLMFTDTKVTLKLQ